MATRKVYDLVATVGKYTDHHGQEKRRYQNCGAVFQNDDGNFSIKLEALPLSPEWSGWLSCFDANRQRPPQQHQAAQAQQQHAPQQQQQQGPPQQQQSQPPAQQDAFQGQTMQQPPSSNGYDQEDDIPF